LEPFFGIETGGDTDIVWREGCREGMDGGVDTAVGGVVSEGGDEGFG